MDTTFIKMADCPEIQDGWQPKTADFYCYANKIHTVRNYLADQVKTYGDIWLPTQSQLQEMVESAECYHNRPRYLLTAFLKYCTESLYLASMEQLWLAFVMKEKFNKTWDGDRYV